MSDYADTADRTYSREEVEAYIRKAHERGKAVGRAEGEESIKHGLKTLAGLNGSGDAVLRMIRKAERMEARRVERVEKAAATFAESEHPRGHDGQFIPKGEIDEAARAAAKGDHGKANELRGKVRPEDAAVLEEHLASPGRADPTEATGKVRSQRGIGEEHGHHVGDWLRAVTAAIRHGAGYDHGEIQRATERAVAGQVPKLRRVLRVLDPDTLVSHQPATKEGLQRKIRDLISTAIHAARDIRQHAVRVEKEERERELERHAANHALTLHDSRERLHRFESWHRAAPGDAQARDAVAAAREEVARQLGIEKAFKEGGENESVTVLKAIHHAPAGGCTVGGKDYSGGQFIPDEEVEAATPEERANVNRHEHTVVLPKDPKRLQTGQMVKALDEMGYKLGAGKFDLKTKTQTWQVQQPDGTTATMPSEQIRELIYRGAAMDRRAKAFPEDAVAKARDATGHEHRGAGPGGGQFTAGGGGGGATVADKPKKLSKESADKPTARKAPGSQLPDETKTRLRSLGMVGTFPPADVPAADVKVAEGTAEELQFKPLMQWNQRTGSGRISRQYRYTQAFHDRNAAEKFDRVMAVEPSLAKARKALEKRMTDSAIPERDRDAAAIASVIAETGLRPTDGDDSVAHGHYGIASLLTKHAKIEGGAVHLDFIGKEGVRNQTVIREAANVAYLKAKLAGKGADDPLWSADSGHAGDALKEAVTASGGPADVKLKDLRTIKATQTARSVVSNYAGPPPPLTGDVKKDAKAIVSAVLKMSGEVAAVLNNTATQARDNYIHPEVFRSWQKKLESATPAKNGKPS